MQIKVITAGIKIHKGSHENLKFVNVNVLTYADILMSCAMENRLVKLAYCKVSMEGKQLVLTTFHVKCESSLQCHLCPLKMYF